MGRLDNLFLPKVTFTRNAKELLERMVADHPDLTLVLDDSTCCTVSNVFVRNDAPPWAASRIEGYVPIYVHPSLEKSLKSGRVVIDVLDFADDSLSLETNYGKRLVMLSSVGFER